MTRKNRPLMKMVLARKTPIRYSVPTYFHHRKELVTTKQNQNRKFLATLLNPYTTVTS